MFEMSSRAKKHPAGLSKHPSVLGRNTLQNFLFSHGSAMVIAKVPK